MYKAKVENHFNFSAISAQTKLHEHIIIGRLLTLKRGRSFAAGLEFSCGEWSNSFNNRFYSLAKSWLTNYCSHSV